MPTIATAIPPRENVKYSVTPTTGSATADATRTHAGSRSEAVKCVARITPSAQNIPIAFQ